MDRFYGVQIKRVGIGDLPELVRCLTAEAAGEVVRALLACADPHMEQVIITVLREPRLL